MAIFTDKIISTKFIDPPNNMLIELLYRENDSVIPYIIEVDFTSKDFNDLLLEVTLEEIEKNTIEELKAEQQVFESIIQRQIETRWSMEQDKIKAAYDEAESYAQKVIEREYEQINTQHDVIADEWKKIYDQWDKINTEYQKLEKASGEINTEYQRLDKEYEKVNLYAEVEKGKKFQEVQEEFQKAREELQLKFNSQSLSMGEVTGKEIFATIDKNNQDDDFVFNLKVSILEDPIIVKSRDKKLKLTIRKSKSVLELLKIYAEAKEAA